MTTNALGTAVTRAVRAGFMQWTGDLSAVREFAGDEFAGIADGGVVLVRFRDTGHLQPVYPRWYLARYEGQDYVRVMSERNFTETFEVTAITSEEHAHD